MDCPRCKVTLSEQTVHQVQAQVCERCRGMFLDRGELNRVTEPTEGDLEFSTLDRESFEHEDRFPVADCPNCDDRPMSKVEFNIYSGIVLDYCDNCGGFWLDGDELGRIDEEVREINEADDEIEGEPAGVWLARFIWSLPR